MPVDTDITPDPLGPEAQRRCPAIRRVADLGQSALVLNAYLWKEDDPFVHFGALCRDGAELLLTSGTKRHVSPSLIAAAAWREGEDLASPPCLCPVCASLAALVSVAAFDAPMAHVDCYEGLISVAYTGSDEEMADAFQALGRRGLVDLEGDATRLIAPSLVCASVRC